tara:strand:- start:330 stop:581 length:252 start_codon:yes stop_codon:yes gene_type:complete
LQYDDLEFKVGDLVLYAPYFNGEGAWKMKGDIGIVVGIRWTACTERFQIVTVKWANGDMGEVDMASQILKKITPDKLSELDLS